MHPIHGIYALCDTTFSPAETHLSLAKKFLLGGIRILQLRMKGESDLSKVRSTAEGILALKKDYDFTFILNDFVELGLELEVDGVHVGRDDLPLSEVKKLAGPKTLVGYSSHSFLEARTAQEDGADYVALGAIFPTPTKGPGHPVVGLNTLRQVVRDLKIPTVAIGGITAENIHSVLATGVDAVAMITALTRAKHIEQAAAAFVKTYQEARKV